MFKSHALSGKPYYIICKKSVMPCIFITPVRSKLRRMRACAFTRGRDRASQGCHITSNGYYDGGSNNTYSIAADVAL